MQEEIYFGPHCATRHEEAVFRLNGSLSRITGFCCMPLDIDRQIKQKTPRNSRDIYAVDEFSRGLLAVDPVVGILLFLPVGTEWLFRFANKIQSHESSRNSPVPAIT